MSDFLGPLLHFQRFFIPGLFVLLVWAIWQTVFRRDLAVGLALYLGIVVIVDVFFNTGIYLPGMEKGSIRYSEVCAVFLFLNRPPARPKMPSRRTIYFLVASYFGLLLISALRSDSIKAGIFEFRGLIAPQIVAFLIAMRGLHFDEDYRRFFRAFAALAIVIGLFSFWDVFFDRWLLHSDILYKPDYWMNRNQRRFGSFFVNPNFMGAFVVLVFPAAFVWALSERRPWFRVYAWTALLALVFCLVETQSRGPMLAFGIALLLLLIGPCGGLSRKRRLGILAGFLVLLMLLMPGFLEHATRRFSDPSLEVETSTEVARSRQAVWVYAERIIGDHLLAGVGFGEKQFLKTMDAYGFRREYGEGSLDNPHNSYLQMAVYAGIPALAAFLLANIVLLTRSARVLLRSGEAGVGPMVFGLAVGITGFLAAIYPDMHMFTPNVAPVYWVFFGLLLSLATKVPEARAT